jgi:hypothetical protein
MRGARRGVLPLVAAVLSGCGESDADTGRVPGSAPEVELFAPGIVSSPLPEFAIAFTPSGDTVFFNRTPPDRSRIDLLYSVRVASRWSDPERFAPLEGVRAIDPFVALDGAYLYFSSDLPRVGASPGAFNLWRLSMTDPDARPEALPSPVNTDSSEVFNSMASDGAMVFSSRRDGERHVYMVAPDGGGFGEPARLVLGDGSPASNPALHPTGRYLVFARGVADGPSDLYVSCRDGTGWGHPILLPEPIKSDFTEFAPAFDREHLYFTSERPGVAVGVPEGERPPGDIYRVRWAAVGDLCASATRIH